MKKKLTAVALVVCMLAVMLVGASLAYFTDTDTKTNVFTVGKVDITLNDKFEQNSKLIPATTDKDNNILNAVDKVVSVTNETGSEEAYVRLHIAVPASIDELIGLWYNDATGWNWNEDTRVDYSTTIDEVEYNVVCLTYSKTLDANATTTNVFEWVTLDPDATNEDLANFENGLKIIVFAEGMQAIPGSAVDALNEAFGTPSAASNPWNKYGADSAAGDAE